MCDGTWRTVIYIVATVGYNSERLISPEAVEEAERSGKRWSAGRRRPVLRWHHYGEGIYEEKE